MLQESIVYRRWWRVSRARDELGLGDAYSVAIGQIWRRGGDKSRFMMEALMWISYAEQSLRTSGPLSKASCSG